MDGIFDALANESRRSLLDSLYLRDGQTLGALCAGLAMSRQAGSLHLAILEKAGLVVIRWKGREKLHFLNPIPIQELSERWLRKYESRRLESLTALKSALEAEEAPMGEKGFVYQVVIAATTEKVWKALTTAEFTRQYWFGRAIASDWKVGSPVTVTTPDGAVEVTGTVLVFEENKKLSYTWGTSSADTDGTSVVFEIVPMGPLVKLVITHDLDMTTASAQQAVNGWTFILNGLKTLLETGQPMPALPWGKK